MARQEHILVGDVDGHIGFLCVVVGQQTDVGQLPAKDVADDEDGGVLVVAGDVGLVLAEGRLLAGRSTVPLESRFAALGHVDVDLVDVRDGWRRGKGSIGRARHGYDLYIVSLIDGLTNLFDPSRSFIARWGKDSL